MLATVKVWPINVRKCVKVGATANLDGVCARRQRAAMPEWFKVRCNSSTNLDNKKEHSVHGEMTITLRGTFFDEAIRLAAQLSLIAVLKRQPTVTFCSVL